MTRETSDRERAARAEVVRWDEFGQGYNAKAECVVCICGAPYPMRGEHYCPANEDSELVDGEEGPTS